MATPKTTSARTGPRPSKSNKTKDYRTIRRFLEELSWVLSTYSHVDFRSINDFLDQKIQPLPITTKSIQEYVSHNPNIDFLVGTLPKIFTDKMLFTTNEEIAQFSENILHVKILRWYKKSKYELIGHIVCNVTQLDDRKLSRVVKALAKISSGDSTVRRIVQQERGRKATWNEIIQQLGGED